MLGRRRTNSREREVRVEWKRLAPRPSIECIRKEASGIALTSQSRPSLYGSIRLVFCHFGILLFFAAPEEEETWPVLDGIQPDLFHPLSSSSSPFCCIFDLLRWIGRVLTDRLITHRPKTRRPFFSFFLSFIHQTKLR